MTERDLEIVKNVIDREKEFLNNVSQEIWKMPELAFKEFQAHAVLTCALKKYGFRVQKHYFLITAFRAEYCLKEEGPTIAVLLEYDALPGIGHACGHNLIAEAGLATAVALKAAMEESGDIKGKIVVLGTPAEELGGGKIRLVELGAFDDIDAAVMVHPARHSILAPSHASLKGSVQYHGKESHAAAYPWDGINALDAAVACYNSIAALRQQLKPDSRVHVIITEGGVATNIIPARSEMKLSLRAKTMGELTKLRSRVEACIKGAATMTGCTVDCSFEEDNIYSNLINNSTLMSLFTNHADTLGMSFKVPTPSESRTTYSTDMGNVSHVVPSLHPFYAIPSAHGNHTRGFTDDSGKPEAQEPTLNAAKALAMTCLSLLRSETLMEEAKRQFQKDLADDSKA